MIEVAAVGALLAPALPYLPKSADQVATQAAEALGGVTWDLAQRVWAKVGGRLRERPAGRVAINEIAGRLPTRVCGACLTTSWASCWLRTRRWRNTVEMRLSWTGADRGARAEPVSHDYGYRVARAAVRAQQPSSPA